MRKHLQSTRKLAIEKGEASCYGNLGIMFKLLGEYEKAREYLEQALAITKEIGDRKGEASSCANLGNVFLFAGE